MSEHDEQTALFLWAAYNVGQYPELALMHAIPNGAKLPWRKNSRGARFSPEAVKLLAEGLRAGVPDVFLPVARDGFHGFYIELKYGDNKPSKKQESFIAALREQGFRVMVFWSWQDAAKGLQDYLECAR